MCLACEVYGNIHGLARGAEPNRPPLDNQQQKTDGAEVAGADNTSRTTDASQKERTDPC